MRAAAVCTFVAVAAWASLAQAADEDGAVISPDAFRAMVEGQTVHYGFEGAYYGSERFYGQDRATWQDPDGDCLDGTFWDVEDELCFNYGNVSCWRVVEQDGGEREAVSRTGLSVDILTIDNRPLKCDGSPIS